MQLTIQVFSLAFLAYTFVHKKGEKMKKVQKKKQNMCIVIFHKRPVNHQKLNIKNGEDWIVYNYVSDRITH